MPPIPDVQQIKHFRSDLVRWMPSPVAHPKASERRMSGRREARNRLETIGDRSRTWRTKRWDRNILRRELTGSRRLSRPEELEIWTVFVPCVLADQGYWWGPGLIPPAGRMFEMAEASDGDQRRSNIRNNVVCDTEPRCREDRG